MSGQPAQIMHREPESAVLRGRLVKLNATSKKQEHAGLTDVPYGVNTTALDPADPNADLRVAEVVTMQYRERSVLVDVDVENGTIAEGDPIYTGAAGQAKRQAGSGAHRIGFAAQDITQSGLAAVRLDMQTASI